MLDPMKKMIEDIHPMKGKRLSLDSHTGSVYDNNQFGLFVRQNIVRKSLTKIKQVWHDFDSDATSYTSADSPSTDTLHSYDSNDERKKLHFNESFVSSSSNYKPIDIRKDIFYDPRSSSELEFSKGAKFTGLSNNVKIVPTASKNVKNDKKLGTQVKSYLQRRSQSTSQSQHRKSSVIPNVQHKVSLKLQQPRHSISTKETGEDQSSLLSESTSQAASVSPFDVKKMTAFIDVVEEVAKTNKKLKPVKK